MNNNTPNREAWLEAAAAKFRPYFRSHGFEIPEIRVSVGWPSRNPLGLAKRTIGECWSGEVSEDGKPQLFISPLLDNAVEPMGVLATLVHEMVHAVVGTEAKHGPKFLKAALRVGLEGKATATHAGETLLGLCERIAGELGPYPHTKIRPPIKAAKKQTTRLLKLECVSCGYVARTTNKWLTEVGALICPGVGHGPMDFEKPQPDEEEQEPGDEV